MELDLGPLTEIAGPKKLYGVLLSIWAVKGLAPNSGTSWHTAHLSTACVCTADTIT